MKAIGGLLPLISLLLIHVVVVAGGDGHAGLSLDGAIAHPAELKAYWEATLPNTPMPQAILDILAPLQDEISVDDRKLGKFFFYNKDQAKSRDDRKLGKFFFYNKDQTNAGDDRKLGKFFFYNK
ncbi:hypothetical protein E2562_025785, partial [Oryza meyeriana var. granulata]